MPNLTFAAFFFFNDTATTEIYTLSLHDALPIWATRPLVQRWSGSRSYIAQRLVSLAERIDRKSTRLNSSHTVISYAVFCLKKKNKSRTFIAASICCSTICVTFVMVSSLAVARPQ